jgi:hypothetical protein
VAEHAGAVAGYGATRRIGPGSDAISMLADLFVEPAAHGMGCGRAILDALWRDEPRRMTFSSKHAHAMPLYTSFGLDAWWPLFYLSGDVRSLPRPAGWSVEPASPVRVAALELAWSGADRTADHQMWALWPLGTGLVAMLDGRPLAAGTAGGSGVEYGISHLVMDAGAVTASSAADAVIAVLGWLDPAGGRARVHLPAPHPATRRLLAAGWRLDDFDVYMATQADLMDPRRALPSPALG